MLGFSVAFPPDPILKHPLFLITSKRGRQDLSCYLFTLIFFCLVRQVYFYLFYIFAPLLPPPPTLSDIIVADLFFSLAPREERSREVHRINHIDTNTAPGEIRVPLMGDLSRENHRENYGANSHRINRLGRKIILVRREAAREEKAPEGSPQSQHMA